VAEANGVGTSRVQRIVATYLDVNPRGSGRDQAPRPPGLRDQPVERDAGVLLDVEKVLTHPKGGGRVCDQAVDRCQGGGQDAERHKDLDQGQAAGVSRLA
jgi:hypothetical protein